MRGVSSTAVFALAALSGCQLFGYEWVASPSSAEDDAGFVDPDGNFKATPSFDARSEAAAEACVPNACGGCTSLRAQPASACGGCGLGRYACEGTDALVCQGGDATPTIQITKLIDDWDDGDAFTSSGQGYTYAYSDGSAGELTPASGARVEPTSEGAEGSAGCAHIAGSGFSNFAGMIVKLNAAECAFDASSARGIEFWMKGSASEPVYVSAASVATRDPAYCGELCNDFHLVRLTLDSAWQHFMLPWSEFAQSGWGAAVELAPSQLVYLQFSFGPNASFELYVDELAFF